MVVQICLIVVQSALAYDNYNDASYGWAMFNCIGIGICLGSILTKMFI